MARQPGQRLFRDCQCQHVLFICFLVWWLSFFKKDLYQVGRLFAQKLCHGSW